MSTPTTSSLLRRDAELLGQTVVVIGGSAGVGLEPRDERALRGRRKFSQVAISSACSGPRTNSAHRVLHPARRMARRAPQSVHATLPIRRAIEPTYMAALAYIMINSALTGATYDIDGRQQFVGAATLSSRSPSWRNEHDAITGSESQASGVKIRFVIGQTSIAATLDDSGTTKDFTSRLPLELELKNLVAREKSGDLPRALLEDAPRTYTYEVGDVVYWPPGPHVAVFYRQDGRTVTSGMIRLGAVDAGVDALAPSSSVRATIELAK